MANPEFFQDPEENEESSLQAKYDAISIPKEDLLHVFKDSLPLNVDFIAVKQKADQGDAEAQFYTGMCYYEGCLVKNSYKLAFHYYQLAAEQGLAQAQLSLALLYEEGQGTKQSYEKAFHYYKLAADQANPTAQFKVGEFYAEGKGVRQSFENAVVYYQMAADQDCPNAWRALAVVYEKGNGIERSHEKADFYNQKWFHYYKSRADQGDPEAQATIGFLFEQGVGVDRSLDSAFHYYSLSAEQGFARGLCGLADCYAKGKGVNKSVDRAIHFYQLAIKEGSTLAMYCLATLLFVNKLHEEEAVHYFQMILQRKSEFNPALFQAVHYWLGDAFENGIGTKKSTQNALNHFRMSADLGDLLAQKKLANAYLNGELGVKKDIKKALHYYQQAANQRDPSSLVFLGKCYENGVGVEQSLEHAFQFYRLASDIDIKEGTFLGIFECARCYEEGIGIEKSLETAIHYYKLSAENGHPHGYSHVGTCYQKIGGEEAEEKAALYMKLGGTHVSTETAKELRRMKEDHRFESKEKGNQTVSLLTSIFLRISSKESLASLIRMGNDLQKEGRDQEAFDYLKKAADQGDPNTQNKVGYYYEIGKGVEKDLAKAFHYYELAANQNHNHAICNLATCYKEGWGVDKSAQEAFNLFKKAADQKIARGQYHVAYCYQFGVGVEISLNKAIEYYRFALAQRYEIDSIMREIDACEEKLEILEKLQNAADKGDALSQYELGRAYSWGDLGLKKDRSKAVYYYTLAAEQGNLQACRMLFYCYYEGLGVEKSFEKALQYIKILVDHNQPEFLDYLGEFFEKGYGGLKQSYQEAFKYYKQAADQGYAHSQFVIGEYFKKGLGVEQSAEDAFNYTKLAADGRIPKAQYELGEMYRLGIGTPQSDNHALDYYLRAANRNVQAQEALSKYYHFGSQVDQPYEETLDHIRKLVDQGTSTLQYEVGDAFAEGKYGLKQSVENAFIYYKLAAEQGHPRAQFIVGDVYRRGKGVQQSDKQAREYLKKSAMQGDNDACRDLAQYYQYGIDLEQPYEEALSYIGNLAIKTSSVIFLDNLAGDFEIGRNGLKQSYEEAFKYFKMAADMHQDYSPSQFAVGLYYKNGWGVEQSEASAFEYFMRAKRSDKAQYYIGEAYRTGKGVEQSNEYALKYYKKAAKKGSVEACAALAQYYRYLFDKEQEYLLDDEISHFDKEKVSYAAILQYLEALAPKGSSIFQHNLGVYFEKGINGLKQSHQEAFKYFRMAAEKEYAPSQFALGVYFENGWGVEQSYEKAAEYLIKGAALSDRNCEYELAKYYKDGTGNLRRSLTDAIKYFKLAAFHGHTDARIVLDKLYKVAHPHAQFVDLGSYFLDGQLTTLEKILESYDMKPCLLCDFSFNHEEAHVLCDAMLKNPHFTVICTEEELKRLFFSFELKGYHSDEDLNEEFLPPLSSQYRRIHGCIFIPHEYSGLEKGKTIKLLSGDPSDPEAKFYVSPFRLMTLKHTQENLDLFKTMADDADAEAQFYMSVFHLNGVLEMSQKKAFEYAKLAANQGMPEAQYNLAIFYQEGIGTKKSEEKSKKYFVLAAEQSLAPAQHKVGLLMKDKDYFQTAAEKKYIPSLIRLGMWLSYKNAKEALNYFQMAYEDKDLECFYERWRLENQIERCKQEINIQAQCARAAEINQDLDPQAIYYPNSKQLELDCCPSIERLETLKRHIAETKDQPFHLFGSDLSYEEAIVIRDAMLENPRITVICPYSDGNSLKEAFYRIGYKSCLKVLYLYKKGKIKWYGYLFIGIVK